MPVFSPSPSLLVIALLTCAVMPDTTEVADFLKVLSLNPTRLPTFQEYKKAYREQIKKHPHPDHGGDTLEFQTITEAATHVFEFITKHQNEQKRTDSDSDKNLLRAFELSSNVVYHKGSIVFDIDGTAAQLWIECLKKKVGEPIELADGSGFRMTKDDLQIPLVSTKSTDTNFGSVTVTVYPNPKTSNPKIMIQGKMYMAFVAFIMPMVIKDMKKVSPLSVSNEADNCSDEEELNCTNSDIETLNKSFKRIELEVLNLRDDLVDRVDNASRDHENLGKRLDSLEDLLKKNIEQHTSLTKNIDEISEAIKNRVQSESVTLDPDQLETLAQGIGNLPKLAELSNTLASLRTEVAKSTTLEAVQQQVEEVVTILSAVQDTTNKTDQKLNEFNKRIAENIDTNNQEIKMLRKNSDNSLSMFQKMQASLETIGSKNANTPDTSSPPPSTSSSSKPSPSPTQNPPQPLPTKRGIMFTSSLALNIDLKRFKEELNCDLKIIPTYYIEQNPTSRDPDAYLKCMVNQHLVGKQEFDFAILATGSNDITDLDTENSPPTTLFENAGE